MSAPDLVHKSKYPIEKQVRAEIQVTASILVRWIERRPCIVEQIHKRE